MNLKPLDPLLHSQLRLAIMSLLINLESADFKYLQQETEASKGNLSIQLKKLSEAGYIKVHKSFKDNYPHTELSITAKGHKAFEEYVAAISKYLNPEK